MEKQWISIYIPFILQSGYTPPVQRIIVNNIIPCIFDDMELCYKFYFECQLLINSDHVHKAYFIALLDRFMDTINDNMKKDIEKTEILIRKLKQPLSLKQEYSYRGIRLPFDPSIVIDDIQTVNMIQLNTYTKPWIIPLVTNKGNISILLKTDDIRKDRFVMNIIDMLSIVSKDMKFKKYHCMPISEQFGIVEMIRDSETLFDINKTTNIANYIIKNNINQTMYDIRNETFLRVSSKCRVQQSLNHYYYYYYL
jgi:hypothetical protein